MFVFGPDTEILYSRLFIDYVFSISDVTQSIVFEFVQFSRQESEVRKNDNRTGGAAISDGYPKPN